VTLLPAPPVALQTSPAVLAAGLGAGGVVAVALADGGVALASHGAAPGWLDGPLASWSASPVTALAVVDASQVVVAKAAEGLVSGLSRASGLPAWSVAIDRPSALCGVSASLVWAAGEGDNWLLAIDPSAGRLVGRRNADLGAAAASFQAGATFGPAGFERPGVPRLAGISFPVTRPAALVTWPLGGDPLAAVQPVDPGLVAWDPAAEAPWVGGAGAVSLAGGAPIPISGLEALARCPAGLVTLGAGLSLVQAGVPHLLAADLDVSIALPACSADGRLLAVGSMGGAERARLWSADALGAFAPASLEVELPGFALLGAFVDGQPWVSWLDGGTMEGRTARLGAGGALLDEVAGALPSGVASPNGRTVAFPERGLLSGGLTSLRVVALEPAGGFPTLHLIELSAPVVGLAFDETGERLYVVTRSPDQLLVVE
jgi:hypothetical protein